MIENDEDGVWKKGKTANAQIVRYQLQEKHSWEEMDRGSAAAKDLSIGPRRRERPRFKVSSPAAR